MPLIAECPPRKERQQRRRLTSFVAKVEVLSAWIIKVYRLLDHSQTEDAAVEVDGSLGIAGDSRDMMYTEYFIGHFGSFSHAEWAQIVPDKQFFMDKGFPAQKAGTYRLRERFPFTDKGKGPMLRAYFLRRSYR